MGFEGLVEAKVGRIQDKGVSACEYEHFKDAIFGGEVSAGL